MKVYEGIPPLDIDFFTKKNTVMSINICCYESSKEIIIKQLVNECQLTLSMGSVHLAALHKLPQTRGLRPY